jgi:hypothetical protein
MSLCAKRWIIIVCPPLLVGFIRAEQVLQVWSVLFRKYRPLGLSGMIEIVRERQMMKLAIYEICKPA